MTEPILAVSVAGQGRMYRHPQTRELYPSVTNIIDVLAKPWLGAWAAKLVAEYAWDSREVLSRIDEREAAVDMLKGAIRRKRDRAADVGSTIHAFIESLVLGTPAPALEEEHVPYIEAVQGFLDEFDPEFLVVEGTVFSSDFPPELRYAGTFDFLARVDGALLLGDYKTGSGVYDEVALQLAALSRAESVWDRHTGALSPMPTVDACVAVHLRPREYALHVIRADDLAYQAFLGLRQAWPWTKNQAGIVGPRMNRVRLGAELSSAGEGPAQPSSEGARPSALAAEESSVVAQEALDV